MASGFMVWFRVLGASAAIIIAWVVFYDPVMTKLYPLAVAAPGVPSSFGDNFTMFWYFWPIALIFGLVVWGIL
jgi:hypothetical protein